MSLEKEIIKFMQRNRVDIPNDFQERYDYALEQYKTNNPVRTGFTLMYAISEIHYYMKQYGGQENANEPR